MSRGESPGCLADTWVLNNLSGPTVSQTHSPCCSLCLECPFPSMFSYKTQGSSISSSVKLSLTSSGRCASAALPEPYPRAAILCLYFFLP